MQNKTLAPVQWQVPVLAVRAMRWGSTAGTVLLSWPAGAQGTSLGCSHCGGEEPTHSLESGAFKHKLWVVQRKITSVCIEGSGTETLPPLSAALTHCTSSSCNNSTGRPRPVCNLGSQSTLPAWALHTVAEETQAHRAAGMEQEWDTRSETQTLPHLWFKDLLSHTCKTYCQLH